MLCSGPVCEDLAIIPFVGPNFGLLVISADWVTMERCKRLADGIRWQRELTTFNSIAGPATTTALIFGVWDRIELGPESLLDRVIAAKICRLNFVLRIVEANYIGDDRVFLGFDKAY